jgi:hypothetical protein
MGNTIRREPVNFAIPKSPDYKFLNITNFRGLDISSNPFELATNTASDCLNVYVDETNTLTTRPRLQKKYQTGIAEFIKEISDNAVLIGVYPVSFGYLFNVKVDTLAHMYLLSVEHNEIYNITTTNEVEIPDTKCMVFEQNDKIFLLANGRYLYVDIPEDMTNEDIYIRPVEGYVPTTHVVALDGSKKENEALNLLSDKYKVKYYWDIDQPVKDLPQEYINEGFVQKTHGYYEDGSDITVDVKNGSSFVYYKKDVDSDFEKVLDLTSYGRLSPHFVFAKHVKAFLYVAHDAEPTKFVYVYNYNNEWKVITRQPDEDVNYWSMAIADDEYAFAFATNEDATAATKVVVNLQDSNLSENAHYTGFFEHMAFYKEVLYGYDLSEDKITVAEGSLATTYSLPEDWTGRFLELYCLHAIERNTLCFIDTNSNQFVIITLYDNAQASMTTQQLIFNPVKDIFPCENHIYSAWYLNEDSGEIMIIPNIRDINKNHLKTGIRLTPEGERVIGGYVFKYNFRNDALLYLQIQITTYDSEDVSTTKTLYVEYERLLTNNYLSAIFNSINNEDWTEHRQKLLNSTMMTRFDNNYWFASGNNYYRSRNNDPTYFPITEYDSLGDTKEHITGFNLANDTTLLAYKPNKVYLIQPFFSEATGDIEYSKTESKNTVGNTAIGAPIVTTLTEIPLQINYDGIYGLSQLANVSAVERIADLISEPINHKWLDIPTEVIDKAQTLNRLYWTYIILPRETNTQIFLLDNRTNSWYYWELPIKVKTSFVIDNRAEFVDEEGTIYYLTSEDIINNNFLPLLVTEYYDEGKILIPWYWQSQIMHLGTMNYTKRLVNTTFVLTDTDTQDGFGLKYSFKVFRKLASSTPEKEISNDFNLVRSTTKKTNISKFGFIQLKISNIPEVTTSTDTEVAYRNNKLRLVGLGLKYVLLEGLIR